MVTYILLIYVVTWLVTAETILVSECIEQASGVASDGIKACYDLACEYLIETGPVTVQFPPNAVLNLTSPVWMSIKNRCCQGGLTVDGNGATLIQTIPTMGFFYLSNCEDFLIKNLTFDYNPLPFTQGRVKNIISRTEIEVAIEPGFPSPMDYQFTVADYNWGILKDKTQPILPKLGDPNVLSLSSWVSNGIVDGQESYNVTSSMLKECNVELDDPWVHLARKTAAPTFLLWKGSNVTFEDITIHASPASAFVSTLGEDYSYIRCYVIVKDGRYQTIAADGIFVVSNRAGPLVKDCILESLGDDALIFKTSGCNVEEVSNNGLTLALTNRKSLVQLSEWETGDEYLGDEYLAALWALESGAWNGAFVGDILAAFNPESGTYLGTAMVMGVELSDPSGLTADAVVELDSSFDGLVPGTDWNSTIIYNLNTTNYGYEVINTTVISSRRWAVLTMATSGSVVDSTFIGNPSSAVMIINSGVSFEDNAGFMTKNFRLENNYFSDNVRSMQSIYLLGGSLNSVITCLVWGLGQPPVGSNRPSTQLLSYRGHENIQIIGNRISQLKGDFPAIMLGNVNGAVVSGNVIQKNGTSPAISLFDVKSITISKNTFSECAAIGDRTENVFIARNNMPDYCPQMSTENKLVTIAYGIGAILLLTIVLALSYRYYVIGGARRDLREPFLKKGKEERGPSSPMWRSYDSTGVVRDHDMKKSKDSSDTKVDEEKKKQVMKELSQRALSKQPGTVRDKIRLMEEMSRAQTEQSTDGPPSLPNAGPLVETRAKTLRLPPIPQSPDQRSKGSPHLEYDQLESAKQQGNPV